jgi:hypothetical protein
MGGYKSQIMIIPDANFGAVILTNSDEGGYLLRPFGRKLIELLYDAEPKASASIAASVASTKAYLSKERADLTIPADPSITANLAAKYSSKELGVIEIRRENGDLILDTGVWSGLLATKVNDDNTKSLVVSSGATRGVELLIGKTEDGERILSLITPQHSYVLTEAD